MKISTKKPTGTVFVDADSLITINKELIGVAKTKLEMYKRTGFDIILWSNKGRKYCEALVRSFDLQNLIDLCVDKPKVIIDNDHNPFRQSKVESINTYSKI